jgi:Kef-type K+ transport system membrane component KefB
VAALVLARGLAKITGISVANWGSGTNWRQAFWTGCAMSPMSSVSLLMVSQFASTSPSLGPSITNIALPAILLMEVLGAAVATFALHRARETSLADAPEGPLAVAGETRG